MHLSVLTLFPELFEPFFQTSIIGRARRTGALAPHLVQIRDFATDRHRSVDDTPYGGGAGMVMKPDVLAAAVQAAEAGHGRAHRIFLTPQGAPLTQSKVVRLAAEDHLLLVCGRYEGIDERFRERYIDEEISLGDFVLAGGEIAAMALIEAVGRLLPGVMGNQESAGDESFSLGGLEYPHYTRPRIFEGLDVPGPLLEGDHAAIRAYRRKQALLRTAHRRPDLLAAMKPSPEEWEWLDHQVPDLPGPDHVRFLRPRPGVQDGKVEASTGKKPDGKSAPQGEENRVRLTNQALGATKQLTKQASRTYLALLHHPVYDKNRRIVTTAVTNLDIHDLARASRTYALAGYYVVTPIDRQQELVARIRDHWTKGHGSRANKPRRNALELLRIAAALEDVVAEVAAAHDGVEPAVAVTTARPDGRAVVATSDLFDWPGLVERPLVLVFGTGWGLTPHVLDQADICLEPIEGLDGYNHLSVRSAVSIYLDRIFGRGSSREGE